MQTGTTLATGIIYALTAPSQAPTVLPPQAARF